MTGDGFSRRRTGHPPMRSGEVLMLRRREPAGPLPPSLPEPRRVGRVDAWIVMGLVVASTLLAVYDTYLLLTFVPR